MAAISVSEQDVTNAEAYLVAYLKEKVPEADFSPGSVVRDFVVKAIAYIFAFFRAEIQKTRDYQSLAALQQLPASAEVDEAVTALLSNLFITRRPGTVSRVVATLHFSNSVDVVIAPTIRFFRNGLAYTIDSAESLFIPRTSLSQVLTASAASAEYTTNVTLVCSTAGSAGDAAPGRFTSADRFNAYFTYAENTDYGSGGLDVETSAELLKRAPTALSVRNLANVRSVQSVLLELFPSLSSILTVGFGDAEMTRDRATEGVTQIAMHTGGYMDVYVKLPIVNVTELLTVGAPGSRADGIINVFYDAAADFTAGAAVVPGDVLKIHNGIPGAPREFMVREVFSGQRLFVSSRSPFPAAVSGLTYSIGAQAPFFSEKRNGSTTGETTNFIQATDAVFPAGAPRGKIRKLEISTDSGTTWGALERQNLSAPGTGKYTVDIITPELFQSDLSVEKITLPAGSDTQLVRLTYDTLSGFDAVNAKVTDSFDRNVCANNIVRGFIPVYLGVAGTYALKTGAAAIDETLLKQTVSTFLQEWDASQPLDVSAVTTFLRATFPSINRFYDPVTILFTVYAPDGQLYEFQTTDVVTVFPDGRSNVSLRGENAMPLRNEATLAGLRLPGTTAFDASLLELQAVFKYYGVTARNVRFLPDGDVISITPYID